MMLRLDPEDDELLEALAREDDTSKNQEITRLIRREAKRRMAQDLTSNLLDAAASARPDLMRRLGE